MSVKGKLVNVDESHSVYVEISEADKRKLNDLKDGESADIDLEVLGGALSSGGVFISNPIRYERLEVEGFDYSVTFPVPKPAMEVQIRSKIRVTATLVVDGLETDFEKKF